MKNKVLISLFVVALAVGTYVYSSRSGNLEECGWDKIQSNAEMTACLKNLKGRLLQERGMAYNDYLALGKEEVDPNFSIPLVDVKEKTTTWYKSTDSYRKAHCEARVANFADGSGYFEAIEMCEIELIRQDIQFLKDRIEELVHYSTNFEP